MPDQGLEPERLLEQLSNAYGPTGFEEPVRAVMRRELAPYVDRLETDGVGSLIAELAGRSERPRVMLAAHMDEVGLMVRYITPEGYVKFQTLGGWLDQALVGQRWAILTAGGPVHGVTGLKSVHVVSTEERNRPFKRQDIFIDVGAASKEDAERRLDIRPGDPIAPDSRFTRLNGEGLYLGKGLDNRIGLAVMARVMRALRADLPPNTVLAVSTVQEEVGLRGAQTSSFKVEADVGVCIEAGLAGDHPGMTLDDAQEKLGGGPAVFLHDSSMIPNLRLRDLVVEVARDNAIPVQFSVLSGYGEDGSQIQRSRAGAPAINIAVPTRYLHTHNSVVSRDDYDRAVALVTALVRRLDAPTVEQLKPR